MLKIIDRYIVRKFLGTYFLTIALMLSIAVVFDISEKIDDFIEEGATVREIILDYYLNFVIFYGNLFSAMIVFIATIFFTSRMAANTEIVAILTGGVSFRRLMWPYFIAATILAGINFTLSHYIIPATNVDRLEFKQAYIDQNSDSRFKNIHRQIQPGHIVYFESFNTSRLTGYHFSYEIFKDHELRFKMKSDFIRYDTTSGKWRIDNYVMRHISKDGDETLEQGRRKDTVLQIDPYEIVPKLYTIEMMNTPQLNDFIEEEKMRGSENINYYLIEKHRRTAFPLATYVLVLIGVTLSSQKKRGGIGVNIAAGLLLGVTYIFLMQISTTFSTLGNLSPLLAVWLPNIIFSVIALYMYRIAPK